MKWFKTSSSKKTHLHWEKLTSIQQFDELLETGNLLAVFKHSTRCSLSSMALNRLESGWDIVDDIPIYYLDLIQFREVSNYIADKTGVVHQSPQLILIKNGKAVYDSSHNGIQVDQVKTALASI